MLTDTLAKTLSWFQKAVPAPNSKQLHTQLGVHFEEVNEMVMALSTKDFETQIHLDCAMAALNSLASHLKSSDNVIEVATEDRLEFLDALADQIVTAVGCAHVYKLDIVSGLNEVNASNFSKFDHMGDPIFNENMKIIKGPHYFKADLSDCI